MTAWLTYPVRRTYLLPVVVESALDAVSTKRLIAFVQQVCPDGGDVEGGRWGVSKAPNGDVGGGVDRGQLMKLKWGPGEGRKRRVLCQWPRTGRTR